MAEKKKLSVEEILAQCRRIDSGGDAADTGAPAPPTTEPAPPAAPVPVDTTPAEAAAAETPAAATAPPAGAPLKKASEMSVAEILAAARAGKASASPAAAPPASAEPSAAAPASAAAKPAAAPKKAGEMSVADILAAARGKAPAGTAAAPAPAKPAAAKPAAAKPAAKPAAEKAAAEKPTVQPGAAAAYDTTSILAAARGGAKPGPMSKAEAAAKGAPAAKAAAAKPTLPPRPERPAYLDAPAATATATAAPSRRTFFGSFGLLLFGSSLAVGFSSLFVTNLLWLLGLARYMFPNILIEPPTVFKVGFPTDYAPGQVETKYVAQFGVWIVRFEYEGQSQIYALRTVCTHLGCTPNWLEGEQKFKCPCHGSGFYKDGINFEGPAPRPLERFAIRLADDGQLEVDKSRKFQEELGQWQDASSFVVV